MIHIIICIFFFTDGLFNTISMSYHGQIMINILFPKNIIKFKLLKFKF